MAHRIPLGLFRLLRDDRRTRPSGRTLTPPPIPGYRWAPLDGEAPSRAVLMIHGLDEPGRIWDDAAPAVAEAGLPVLRFDYPNDQPIAASADLFAAALAELAGRGYASVDLVAHSMGGLISREVLTRPSPAPGPAVQRLITVGTPNRGSVFANSRWVAEVREQVARWADSPGWLPPGSASPQELRGGAATDLKPGSAFLEQLNRRGLPAGTRITVIYGRWWPFAVSENSVGRSIADAFGDGVVSLASALLPGVDDHVLLQGNHRTMLRRLGARAILRARTGRTPDGPPPPAVPVILDRLLRSEADRPSG